ncbi:MAG: hypothetical protein VR68_11680 [Peptococcaceae bacterium BRH_c4a]|nr:MAG: hypothetical protein VR68_11680 [Peptococcaceae bacterium BRH_c4a]
MGVRKDKKSYPEEVKEIALEAYHVTGSPTQVGAAMGIPPSTIGTWEERREEPARDASSMTADYLRDLRIQKKREFIEAGWLLAMKFLAQLDTKLKDASFKDIATATGILFDKLALAMGEATNRTEKISSDADREAMIKAAQDAAHGVVRDETKKAIKKAGSVPCA